MSFALKKFGSFWQCLYATALLEDSFIYAILNMKPKHSSGGTGLIFKSSINAICQWWIVSVGLSAFIYILYILIQKILDMFKPNEVDIYHPTFDDVVSVLNGRVHTYYWSLIENPLKKVIVYHYTGSKALELHTRFIFSSFHVQQC